MAEAFRREISPDQFFNKIQEHIYQMENIRRSHQSTAKKFELKTLKKIRCIFARSESFSSHEIALRLFEVVASLMQPAHNRQVRVASKVTFSLAFWVTRATIEIIKHIHPIKYYAEALTCASLGIETLRDCMKKLKELCEQDMPFQHSTSASEWSRQHFELERLLSDFARNSSFASFFLGEIKDEFCLQMSLAADFDCFVSTTSEGGTVGCASCPKKYESQGSDFSILNPCLHATCSSCVKSWFKEQRKTSCPTCEKKTLSVCSREAFDAFTAAKVEFTTEYQRRQRLRIN